MRLLESLDADDDRHRWVLGAFSVLALSLLAAVFWDAFFFRIATYSRGGDYWEHAAALRALLDSPAHPRNPQLAVEASSPRFIPHYVLIAAVGRLFAVDALSAMGVAAVFSTVLLLAGIFVFFRLYFRDPRAPLYGLIVMFTSWWDAWQFSNVYQLSVYFSVAAYPSIAALAMTLLCLAAGLQVLRSARRPLVSLPTLVLGVACAVLTHPLTAVLLLCDLLLLTITERDVTRSRRVAVASAPVVGCFLASLWPFFSPWEVVAGGHAAQAAWGSLANGTSQQLHWFYRPGGLLSALGLATAGVPIVFYLLYRRKQWFVALGALVMTVPFVINAFVPVPFGHRFILFTIFHLQLAVTWALLEATPDSERTAIWMSGRARTVATLAVGGVLVAQVALNVGMAKRRFVLAMDLEEAPGGRGSPYVVLAQRVADVVGTDAVVLASPMVAWSLPAFGPRVVPLLHPNPLVGDLDARNLATWRFFATGVGNTERANILKRYGVTHVLARAPVSIELERFLGGRSERKSIFGYGLYAIGKAEPLRPRARPGARSGVRGSPHDSSRRSL